MDEFQKYYTTSLKFLGYRMRSEKEVRDNLSKKNASEEIIEKVIARLLEQRFLNDEEFTKMWIRQRTEFNPKSLRVIKLELRQKGIDPEIIEKVLISHSPEEPTVTDLEKAKAIVAKRIGKYKGMSHYEILQKLGPYLARRGFDYETIKDAIRSSLDT